MICFGVLPAVIVCTACGKSEAVFYLLCALIRLVQRGRGGAASRFQRPQRGLLRPARHHRRADRPRPDGAVPPLALAPARPGPQRLAGDGRAVPDASCRRLSVSLSAVSSAYSAKAALPISKNKGRGASPLPLRPAPVLVRVCAALLRCMGGFGRSKANVLKLSDG